MIECCYLPNVLSNNGPDGLWGRGGARSWKGSLLSSPLAVDFWPGQEEGLRDVQLVGEFAFHYSCSLLQAWPRGGCGGVLPWSGV